MCFCRRVFTAGLLNIEDLKSRNFSEKVFGINKSTASGNLKNLRFVGKLYVDSKILSLNKHYSRYGLGCRSSELQRIVKWIS